MRQNDDGRNDVVSGTRRTRSQAAPDWSITESLILVNEVAAVEADCSITLSSYQRWNIIADNCAALDVPRNLAQCRRKWHALLSDYDRFRETTRRDNKFRLPTNFDAELFRAIERVVKSREERGEVDPESDTEAGNEARDATVEIGGCKRKRQRSRSERHRVQKLNKCFEQEPEESHDEGNENNSDEEFLKDFLESKPKMKCTAEKLLKHPLISPKNLGEVELHENHNIEGSKLIGVEKLTISREENEETMTLKLQELAEEIQAIATESAADYKGAGSQNVEDYHTEFTRCQGDKLIASLGDFSNTLKQLCDLLQRV
ncbi:uncharacterized protein LOC113846218 [Abrus precatorius]|uniref:Uncharacterized protein LOC113846218 n=1 Tax=Abrus precatorius TaxID=3816 RepID=A0A8B8JGT9_ABRPR|nr:uncharacterized protein LOC113846218 [Abrus precatorius]